MRQKVKDFFYGPVSRPWMNDYYSTLFRRCNLRISRERAFLLLELLKSTLDIKGDVAEMGVYKGSTSYLILDALHHSRAEKKLFLFDTFTGTPPGGSADNLKRKGMYSDTSLKQVMKTLGPFTERIVYKPGLIPATFRGLESAAFSFVHIHLNLYASTRDAMEFSYSKVSPGGIILIEDYGLRMCAGVKSAIDEFCDRIHAPVVHVPTGQAVMFKRE